MSLEQLTLPNLKIPRDGVYSCGQPTPEQLKDLHEAGVRSVVNLRAPHEHEWDERAAVEELGMTYYQLPITGPGDITQENARRLSEIMEDEANKPVLIHCGSGNRVGALYALKAYHFDDHDGEEAVEAGRAAGLEQLEPFVRQCLNCK